MVNKEYIAQRLQALQIETEVLAAYAEEHRFYHTLDHIIYVLNQLHRFNVLQDDELFLAAVFHDAVYDPRSQSNEADSATYFLKASGRSTLSPEQKAHVQRMIEDTKDHQPRSDKAAILIQADLAILDEPLDELIHYEHAIFKEFQHVDFRVYREKRLEVLRHYNTNGRLNSLIDYVKWRKPSIAVFPGSFNPFHKGHYNVLIKAECIFDKVIIAFGKNPDKDARNWPLPKTIQNRQMAEYEGLLTDFIDSLEYDVIVIRGLRNSTDFQYEQNQYRYIQELKPDIRIVNIFCDKEYEHISSSGIRTLEKYNKHYNYLLD